MKKTRTVFEGQRGYDAGYDRGKSWWKKKRGEKRP